MAKLQRKDSPKHKIYLRYNYKEVTCGDDGPSLKVQVEHDEQDIRLERPPRYFVLGTDEQEAALEEFGFLEGQTDDEAVDPDNEPPDAPLRDPKKIDVPPAWPESYLCEKHDAEHKAGSAAYVACMDAYQEAQEKRKKKAG